ncbi:hypothetical protein AVEN_42379-1 [Araneus ventricosus]|uniref:Uncharacterized protein n=1 Tax=Araneus ventricosus TaxID=182803 RepID=A0A4Y2UDP7_ARAVE|nr:hypothetical protein AVEN_42379-1 [Araneus ventricosus]
MERSRLQDRNVSGSKPDSTKDPSCVWVWFKLNLMSRVKPLRLVWCPKPTSTDSPIGFRVHKDPGKMAGVVRKFGEESPVQVSSTSSDRSSKFWGWLYLKAAPVFINKTHLENNSVSFALNSMFK